MEVLKNLMSGPAIYIALILLLLSVGLVLIFAIKNIVSDFEGSKKGLLGIVATAVIVLIGFALSTGTIPVGIQEVASESGIGTKGYKAIGAIVNTAVIAIVSMIGLLLVDGVLGIFRR